MSEDARQPHPPRAARTRRPRGSLSREVILDAAEAVAEPGFDALTMRAVAARLGAVPMALYNHFATKEELVDALLDRVLARFEPPPPTRDWRDDLRGFARAHLELLVRHPWAVAPLFARASPGPAATRIGERALEILRLAGFSGEEAVAAFSGLIALNYGWSSFLVARERDLGPLLAALSAAELPLTLEVAGELAAYGSDRHYAFVLDRFVAGLARS